MIRAPRPRVVSVTRHHPGQVTPGDTAEVRLEPGLIAFLENTPAGTQQTAIGAGFQARYNIPASMAASAAAAVLSPADRADTYWSGRDLEVAWSGAPGPDDTVLAVARLENYSERLARFAIYGRTLADAPLYRGTLRMMAIRDGCPAGFRSRAEYESVRAKLTQSAAQAVSPVTPSGLQLVSAPASLLLGRSGTVIVTVSNYGSSKTVSQVIARQPVGVGLSLESPSVQQVELAPGESIQVTFKIRADRPHLVNLGKPWELHLLTVLIQYRLSLSKYPTPIPDAFLSADRRLRNLRRRPAYRRLSLPRHGHLRQSEQLHGPGRLSRPDDPQARSPQPDRRSPWRPLDAFLRRHATLRRRMGRHAILHRRMESHPRRDGSLRT